MIANDSYGMGCDNISGQNRRRRAGDRIAGRPSSEGAGLARENHHTPRASASHVDWTPTRGYSNILENIRICHRADTTAPGREPGPQDQDRDHQFETTAAITGAGPIR